MISFPQPHSSLSFPGKNTDGTGRDDMYRTNYIPTGVSLGGDGGNGGLSSSSTPFTNEQLANMPQQFTMTDECYYCTSVVAMVPRSNDVVNWCQTQNNYQLCGTWG